MNIPGATPEEIDIQYKLAYKSFYHRPKYILRRLLMLRSIYDIKNALKAVKMTINVHAIPEVNFDELEAGVNEQYMRSENIMNIIHKPEKVSNLNPVINR
jgi:uncharacterized protein VirK/YbjX